MIRHRPPNEVIENLRFALNVIVENSHSGLDQQAAETLRNRILGQIAKIEAMYARELAAASSTVADNEPIE
jgi:hypothetical protein